jgi:AmmeMemoRadiSam system protein B
MTSPSVRRAAVAGSFYPADPRALHAAVGELLACAVPLESILPPKALIVPHAGYIYSGPVAAAAYSTLLPVRDRIRRVVLLGPNHRVALRGMALPSALAFDTPLGEVPVDRESWLALQGEAEVVVDDKPHALEHSLEVHLPFLQSVLEHFSVIPLVVGAVAPRSVARVIERLWDGPETLIVVSSDLSHYHSYIQAQRCDNATTQQILELDPTLNHEQACGATPVNGLLIAAARHGLAPHLLDLRNSGDTSGDRQRVVGYTSIALCEEAGHVRH